jgi:polyphosphate kinase 2
MAKVNAPKKNIVAPKKASTIIKKPSLKTTVIPAKKAVIEVESQQALAAEKVITDWQSETISLGELGQMKSKDKLVEFINSNNGSPKKLLDSIKYETELEQLQIELVKLQRWVQESGARVVVLFEGRDAAGKGGTIRRFTEHINPRAMRVVALPKPTSDELGQWYFQRYIKQLPNRGEIVFFDRSWYNRAVVEPVNDFCTKAQYERFMHQVTEFEHMLYEDGITIVKFWFSISQDEQLRRFKSRQANPLKQWKLSPVDMQAQQKWSIYTTYKEEMFNKTHTSFSPWIIVKANNKMKARLESIRYVLSEMPYTNKGVGIRLKPDPNIVARYHRKTIQVDN